MISFAISVAILATTTAIAILTLWCYVAVRILVHTPRTTLPRTITVCPTCRLVYTSAFAPCGHRTVEQLVELQVAAPFWIDRRNIAEAQKRLIAGKGMR